MYLKERWKGLRPSYYTPTTTSSMSFGPGKWVLINVKYAHGLAHKASLALSEGDHQSLIASLLHGGGNQQWDFMPTGSGTYYIKNASSSKFIAFSGDANDGRQVITTSGPRAWEVRVGYEGIHQKDARSSIRIFVPGTSKNLDLKDHGNSAAGSIVQLWTQNSDQDQAWYFERARI
ncbi:unnamed protein product [Rhizoctonia solani]|uniref:Ricin B lectin domain-containing protein n=1 Tax=Rhizoctonia solani TaxID=456999 RepID=A0A8H3GV37_9AGAM|nr:unnamed protein product [Rhizoctonia solani]